MPRIWDQESCRIEPRAKEEYLNITTTAGCRGGCIYCPPLISVGDGEQPARYVNSDGVRRLMLI
jgi:hypothetical protein